MLRVLIDENRNLLCRALLQHTNSSHCITPAQFLRPLRRFRALRQTTKTDRLSHYNPRNDVEHTCCINSRPPPPGPAAHFQAAPDPRALASKPESEIPYRAATSAASSKAGCSGEFAGIPLDGWLEAGVYAAPLVSGWISS